MVPYVEFWIWLWDVQTEIYLKMATFTFFQDYYVWWIICIFFFFYKKHFVDWRLRQWRHQDHRFRTVQDYGLWQLQSWSWHGPDVTGCRNLLVFASRMFRGWQNPTQNLVKSRCVVTRCHFLPMPLWQKGNYFLKLDCNSGIFKLAVHFTVIWIVEKSPKKISKQAC